MAKNSLDLKVVSPQVKRTDYNKRTLVLLVLVYFWERSGRKETFCFSAEGNTGGTVTRNPSERTIPETPRHLEDALNQVSGVLASSQDHATHQLPEAPQP